MRNSKRAVAASLGTGLIASLAFSGASPAMAHSAAHEADNAFAESAIELLHHIHAQDDTTPTGDDTTPTGDSGASTGTAETGTTADGGGTGGSADAAGGSSGSDAGGDSSGDTNGGSTSGGSTSGGSTSGGSGENSSGGSTDTTAEIANQNYQTHLTLTTSSQIQKTF